MHILIYDLYLITCAIAALAFIIYNFVLTGFSFDVGILVFLILLLQNAGYQIKDERASFSINFPLLFPIIAFFGPAWAALLAAIGLISLDEFKENSPQVFLFNRGALGLSAGISAWIYSASGGTDNFVLALLLATIAYSTINIILYLITRVISGGAIIHVFKYLWESVKVILPSSALAALFYGAYRLFDVFGVIAIFYLFTMIRSGLLYGHLEINYRVSLIKALLRAVYAKDQNLMRHLENVAYFTKLLASHCGYPRWKLAFLDEASYLHDIGKLEISDEILKKAGELTIEEYEEMKSHPEKGRKFIKEISLPSKYKEIVENIVSYHHERFDGTGYPYGLKGEDIPLEARIVAIADAWDAMTSERYYRRALAYEEAIAELQHEKGKQFDPKLVDIFVNLLNKEYKTKGNVYANPDINVEVSR